MALVLTNDKHYSDIAAAIRSKNGGSTKYKPEEMAAAIEAIEAGTGEEVESIEQVPVTVTPTGQEFTVRPEENQAFSEVTVEGDSNLSPTNIRSGVTIYGVEGEMEEGAGGTVDPNDPGMTMTAFQASFVNQAKKNYFSDSYSNLIIAETDIRISAIFCQDDFEILTYDPVTTEYTAQGHTVVTWNKETDEWAVADYRDSASTGGNYARHFVYSDMYVKYNDEYIFPDSAGAIMKTVAIDYSLLYAGSFTETLENGIEYRYDVTHTDDSGRIVSISDANGNTVPIDWGYE